MGSAFAASLKSLAANLGIMLAITVAVKALSAAFDYLNVTFEEQQEIVDGLNDKISTLQSEYDELAGKGNLTEQEKNRLAMLERQLEVQNELLEVEMKRLAAKDLEGEGDIFSTGNLEHINIRDGKDTYAGTLAGEVEELTQKLNAYRTEITELSDYGGMGAERYVKNEQNMVDKLKAEREKVLEQWQEYSDSYELIKKYMDMGVWDDDADEKAKWKEKMDMYEIGMNDMQAIADNIDLTLGVEIDIEPAKETLKNAFKGKEGFSDDYVDSLSDDEIIMLYRIENIGKMSFEEVNDLINETRKNAEEEITVEIDTSTKGVLTQLEELSDGFKQLDSIYADIKDKEDFDFSSILGEDFANTFGSYEAEYENFINTVSNSPNDINACKTAFDELTSAWFYGQDALKGITEENKNAVVQWLKSKGVINAVEVADYALAKSQEEAFYSTQDLTNKTGDAADALIKEAEQAGLTGNSLINLRLKMIAVNATPMDFTSQIESIRQLGIEAGVSAAKIAGVMAGASSLSKIRDIGTYQGQLARNGYSDEQIAQMTGHLANYNIETAVREAAEKMMDEINSISAPDINYGGGSKSSGSGDSGSKGSSSSKDPYVADIDKYKELSDAVDEVETKLKHLDQVYSHTDNINERIALKEAEIKLYKEEQDALTALNNARDKEIQENVNKLRKQGFQIEYDPKSDNLQIKNREYLNKISQDDIQTTEKLIKATEELNDANKESAEKWRELTYSIVDTGKSLTELKIDRYEKYIIAQEHLIKLLSNRKDTVGLDIPIYNDIMKTKLNEWKDLVKDGYEKNKEQIQKLENEWMDYYDKRLEREKEILEAQLSDNDKALDGVLNMLDEQSNAIQKQIDALKSANDERREALDLQKAQAALDKARNQRTRLVLRKGEGWVWETKQDEIQSAEQDLADKRFDATISSLEKQKEALDEIKEMWSEIPEIYDKEQAKLMASQLLGKNWEEQVLDGRLDIYEKFKDNYIGIQEDIADKTDELENHMNESYLRMVKIFEAFVKKFSTDLNPEATITSKYQLGEGNKAWYVNKDGKAPSGAKLGDIILTRGGTYKITAKDENGKFTSTKLDDRSSDIKDNMWGRVVADSTDELVDVLGLTTDASKDIVDAAEKQTEQIKNSIITENGLAKFLSENSNLTDEEIDALIDSADFTDENTESTDENTIAIDGLTDELKNFSLEKPIEEFPEDIFDDLDWDSMTTDEKNYINQLKDAYEIALRNGNDYMADKILSFLDDFKNGYGDEYIQIGKDVLAAATTPFGEVTKSTANSADRLSSLEKQLESAKNGGSSQDYIDRLERAIAVEKYGAGTDQYSSSNGYVTQTIISSKDEKEMYMTSDEIKQKYDYENGNKNNGYDPDKMAQTIADRIVESQNNPNSVWGSVVTNDLDKSLTDKVKTDDKSSLGNSGNNKTTTVKLSDSDSDAIKAAQKAYNEAKAKGDTAGMEKAHADAEAIRNKNGYSGGDDGSKVIATSNDKVTKELKNNSGSLSDNSDSNYYAGDSAKEAADKVADSAQTMADSVKDAAKSFLSSGGSSSSKSSGSSKSSSKSNSSSVKDSMSAIVPVINSGSGSSSSSKTSTATTVKNAISTAQKVVSLFKNAPKKASGGINLDPNIYNVDEIDPELLIHPDKGRYVVMEKGSAIVPAKPTKEIWDFGNNPEQYIQAHLPQNLHQSLERNSQFVYNSRKETTNNTCEIKEIKMYGVNDPQEFAKQMEDYFINAPNEAAQWSSVRR